MAEVAVRATARADEGGTGVGVGPGGTAIGGLVNDVGAVGAAARNAAIAAVFVHAGDIHVARGQVAGDLHVSDEAAWMLTCVALDQVRPLSVERLTKMSALGALKSFQETYMFPKWGEAGLLSAQPDSRSSKPPE